MRVAGRHHKTAGGVHPVGPTFDLYVKDSLNPEQHLRVVVRVLAAFSVIAANKAGVESKRSHAPVY
jgi:hypothetical protein